MNMYSCHILLFSFIIFCILYTAKTQPCDYILLINATSNTKPISHFWRSTGFCPPKPRSNISEYMQRQDVKLNIALIGALPHNSIRYIRVHWLLDLIKIRKIKNNGTPVYDFADLDSFLDFLHLQKLLPGFEVMGNPSSFFTNLLDVQQQSYWQQLIREIVIRYSDRYGDKYVSKWRFESWNEPDLKGYNTLNFTLQSYISYINATFNGLTINQTKAYKFGGPAGLFKSKERHPLCWGILEHYAKQNPVKYPLKFISFHKKGDATSNEVTVKGLELVKYIHEMYPNLKQIPIANDESDILTGWSKSTEWRGDVRYAAMVVKVIIEHYNKFINELGIDIDVLSNDNGFLNYYPYFFTQRTILTRFQMNNTNPPHLQFFKKPIYSVMALLSYLGNEVIDVPLNCNYTFLATSKEKNKKIEYSIIISYLNDTIENTIKQNFNISIQNIPKQKLIYVVYLINNNLTNPFKMWKMRDSPVFPNSKIRHQMRLQEDPARIIPPTKLFTINNININFHTTLPGVALIHICPYYDNGPGKVTALQIFNITNMEVIITWKDSHVGTKCILTYEVEYANFSNKIFTRINKNDLIFLWYQHTLSRDDLTTLGIYRVRAVDYWGRRGPYSKPGKYF